MAAERINPALSSIGTNRGGAQVVRSLDPRQTIAPNQAVEDFRKSVSDQIEARDAQRKRLQEAQDNLARGVTAGYDKSIQQGFDDIYSRRGEIPEDQFVAEVVNYAKEAERLKNQEAGYLEWVKSDQAKNKFIKENGRLVPYLESETHYNIMAGGEFEQEDIFGTGFGDYVLNVVNDPKNTLQGTDTTPEQYMASSFTEQAKNYGTQEQVDKIAQRFAAGETFAEVYKTSDLPTEFYQEFEANIKGDPIFKDIYDRNFMLSNNLSPLDFATKYGTQASPQHADYLGSMETFVSSNVPSKAKQTVSVSRMPSPKESGGGETPNSIFSTPAQDTAPIGRNRDELQTASVTVQTDEPFPVKVGTERGYAESRKVHYDPNNNKFYLEYVPYKDTEDGSTVISGGDFSIEERGGSKYKPDYQDVRFVQISEDDPNFESFVSTIAKTTKAERGDIASRIFSLKDAQNDREQGEKKEAQGGYKLGQEVSGYRYTGGDPTDSKNWEEIK